MTTAFTTIPAETPLDLHELDKSLRRPRTLFSATLSVLCSIFALLAAVPLFSVLIMLLIRGGARLSGALFTQLPPAAGMPGGGIGNAIVGTLIVVLVAALFSVPAGVLGGVYLAEIAPGSRGAAIVRFAAKILTGLPSILAGLFVYTAIVLVSGRFSVLAGGVALGILMLPIVVLTTEEALFAVPEEMKEAAVGMGATQTQVVTQIMLPTAMPGIVTGVLLALARGAGETAPLLFTMAFSDYWLSRHLLEPTASLAVLIFNFSKSPFANQKEIAWASSLVLVFIVLLFTLAGQFIQRRAAKISGART